jgi:hypothetical protein
MASTSGVSYRTTGDCITNVNISITQSTNYCFAVEIDKISIEEGDFVASLHREDFNFNFQ